MTCEEAQELITGLVDRKLLDPERASLESHLQECPRCRFAVEREQLLKQTIRGSAEEKGGLGAKERMSRNEDVERNGHVEQKH